MLLTVAICTWNRSALLRQTLEGLCALRVPPGVKWELVVVDNASTDATPAVIGEFAGRLPLRGLVEPEQGLSAARNCAAAHARGEWVVWTDDDVLVGPGWLAAYAEAFGSYPECDFFGGPVQPWFDGEPPAWLREVLGLVSGAFAMRDLGDESFEFTQQLVPFGANMAFRATVHREIPFDTALGRVGARMLGADETTVMRALMAQGRKGRWVPRARVRHFLPRERQTTAYLRRFYAGYGSTMAPSLYAEPVAMLLGRPRWVWREAVTCELRYQATRWLRPAAVWMPMLQRASTAWGVLRTPAPRNIPWRAARTPLDAA